jgi:hypothetical protein
MEPVDLLKLIEQYMLAREQYKQGVPHLEWWSDGSGAVRIDHSDECITILVEWNTYSEAVYAIQSALRAELAGSPLPIVRKLAKDVVTELPIDQNPAIKRT